MRNTKQMRIKKNGKMKLKSEKKIIPKKAYDVNIEEKNEMHTKRWALGHFWFELSLILAYRYNLINALTATIITEKNWFFPKAKHWTLFFVYLNAQSITSQTRCTSFFGLFCHSDKYIVIFVESYVKITNTTKISIFSLQKL